MKLDSSDTGY